MQQPMKSMLEVRRPTANPNLEIALAWHMLKGDGSEMIWHNGGTGGYRSYLALLPEADVGVVILSNSAHSVDALGLADPRKASVARS